MRYKRLTSIQKELEEKYGMIISITNIQMKNCKYNITAETNKGRTVYFTTGDGFDDYKYSPESKDWTEHVHGGLTMKKFQDIPFKLGTPSEISLSNRYSNLYKVYGRILSINITGHWKYVTNAEITFEKKDEPISITLSEDYDDYCLVDTYDLSWNSIFSCMPKDCIVDFLLNLN
jgi:hypothetical protein